MAAQGLVGSVQYELRLPAEMVWVHVGLATFTWLALLWSVAAAGRLIPRKALSVIPGIDAPMTRVEEAPLATHARGRAEVTR
jgi:cytochrome c oxidase assembly protein subunit 15